MSDPLDIIYLRRMADGKRPWVARVESEYKRRPVEFVDGHPVSEARSGNTTWEFPIFEPGVYRIHEEWYNRTLDDIVHVEPHGDRV